MSARQRCDSSEIGETCQPKPDARSFWQTRSSRNLSNDDTRECGVNIVGFFRVLLEWAEIDEAANKEAEESQPHGNVDDGLAEATDE